MKSTFTFILAFLAFAANAQVIPNGNFENWTSNTWTNTPDDWITGNSQLLEPVTQDLDAYEGEYAMKVTSQETGIGEYASASTTFDITNIPATLDFYVKTEVEFGSVQVSITFYNQEAIVITYDWFTSDNIENWTPTIIDMINTEPEVTHAEIVISAQVGDLIAGDAIISIDAMGFGTINGVNRIENKNLSIYPNPANEEIQFLVEDFQIASISVIDITGRLVLQNGQLENGQLLDITGLPEGIYILSANLRNGQIATEKFVVSR